MNFFKKINKKFKLINKIKNSVADIFCCFFLLTFPNKWSTHISSKFNSLFYTVSIKDKKLNILSNSDLLLYRSKTCIFLLKLFQSFCLVGSHSAKLSFPSRQRHWRDSDFSGGFFLACAFALFNFCGSQMLDDFLRCISLSYHDRVLSWPRSYHRTWTGLRPAGQYEFLSGGYCRKKKKDSDFPYGSG